jgi:hypothetical protein
MYVVDMIPYYFCYIFPILRYYVKINYIKINYCQCVEELFDILNIVFLKAD